MQSAVLLPLASHKCKHTIPKIYSRLDFNLARLVELHSLFRLHAELNLKP